MTPPEFYDLFCLCLYYQRDENTLLKCWTTGDKVARVLYEMGRLSSKERKALSLDRRTQHIFLRNGTIIPMSTIDVETKWGHNIGRFKDWETRRKDILATNSHLIINILPDEELNRQKLLRNQRIYMTDLGAAYAEKIQEKYDFTKSKYVEKCEELSLQLTDAQIAAMCIKYRHNLEKELGRC